MPAIPPRIERLEKLIVVRREYLKLVRAAVTAVETARVTLVKAKQRQEVQHDVGS